MFYLTILFASLMMPYAYGYYYYTGSDVQVFTGILGVWGVGWLFVS